MHRVLRPGGHLLVLDFSLPEGPLRRPYRWYLHRVLPKLAGWLTRQPDAYEYLGGSTIAGQEVVLEATVTASGSAIDWDCRPSTGAPPLPLPTKYLPGECRNTGYP